MLMAGVVSAAWLVQAGAQTSAPAQVAPAKAKPAAAPTVAAQNEPAVAAVKTGPDMTSETYGDWVLRCQAVNGVKRCEISQTIMMQGQSSPIALIAFGRDKKTDPIKLVIQLPTNITIAGGVKTVMAADGPVDLNFRRCFPIGCFADASLDDGTVAKLKAQTAPGSVKFKDATEREISLPLSTKGLGLAIDALAKS